MENEKKKITDVTITAVGQIASPPEVSVNMPFNLCSDRQVCRPVPVNTYYVAFAAKDEYDKYQCLIKTSSFANISAIKEILDKHLDSKEFIAILEGDYDNGLLDVSTIIPKKYSC